MLSSWSKFSYPGELFPCSWCSSVSFARVYELKLTNWKFVFYQHLIQLQTSSFQFSLKMRRIAVLVVILFRRHVSDKFQETISCIEAEPGDFSCIAYFSTMLFLTIFGEVIFQLVKIKWECVFILIEFAHGTDVWNSLSSACTSMWALWKLFHPDGIIFARPLTIYNSSEPINSALFSRAKPLLSPRLVIL